MDPRRPCLLPLFINGLKYLSNIMMLSCYASSKTTNQIQTCSAGPRFNGVVVLGCDHYRTIWPHWKTTIQIQARQLTQSGVVVFGICKPRSKSTPANPQSQIIANHNPNSRLSIQSTEAEAVMCVFANHNPNPRLAIQSNPIHRGGCRCRSRAVPLVAAVAVPLLAHARVRGRGALHRHRRGQGRAGGTPGKSSPIQTQRLEHVFMLGRIQHDTGVFNRYSYFIIER
jgi:hypothetical protein